MTHKQGPPHSSNLTNKHGDVNTFDVYDYGLAAALLCLGHELLAMNPMQNCPCTEYRFIATVHIKQDADAYVSGKLSVNAKRYAQALEHIGDHLFGEVHDEN